MDGDTLKTDNVLDVTVLDNFQHQSQFFETEKYI
jgi:hypothetical protein